MLSNSEGNFLSHIEAELINRRIKKIKNHLLILGYIRHNLERRDTFP